MLTKLPNDQSFSDGHIYAKIRRCQLNDSQDESSWWARLTKSKAGILRRVLGSSVEATLSMVLLQIPGIQQGLELGTWHDVLGTKGDEVQSKRYT